MDADLVVIGPGSLFTSILPNLLVPGLPDAIAKTRGKVVLVANLVTQPGETDGFDLRRHVQAIRDLGRLDRLDFILVHDGPVPKPIEDRYRASGAQVLRFHEPAADLFGARIVRADLVHESDGRLRHHSAHLAEALRRICVGDLDEARRG
jgi:uncharacterized cofD-like protein